MIKLYNLLSGERKMLENLIRNNKPGYFDESECESLDQSCESSNPDADVKTISNDISKVEKDNKRTVKPTVLEITKDRGMETICVSNPTLRFILLNNIWAKYLAIQLYNKFKISVITLWRICNQMYFHAWFDILTILICRQCKRPYFFSKPVNDVFKLTPFDV